MANGNECYINLISAIVEQAIHDLNSTETIDIGTEKKKKVKANVDAENFFKSQWFDFLVEPLGIDGTAINVEKLKEEVSA